jgi:hypothetical protein
VCFGLETALGKPFVWSVIVGPGSGIWSPLDPIDAAIGQWQDLNPKVVTIRDNAVAFAEAPMSSTVERSKNVERNDEWTDIAV